MKIHFVTLFPEVFPGYFSQSIVGRAIREGRFEPVFHNLADYSIRPTRRVDRRPYGGFPGMVIEPEPLANVLEKIDADAGRTLDKYLLTPRGDRFEQKTAETLADAESEIVFVCGHYEGIDERVIEYFGLRGISIGDYVLSSGEIAAMVVADAVVRLLPGAIAEESLAEESFSESLGRGKEYPHYTRPEVWRGMEVPPELLSGNPKTVDAWKKTFLNPPC